MGISTAGSERVPVAIGPRSWIPLFRGEAGQPAGRVCFPGCAAHNSQILADQLPVSVSLLQKKQERNKDERFYL